MTTPDNTRFTFSLLDVVLWQVAHEQGGGCSAGSTNYPARKVADSNVAWRDRVLAMWTGAVGYGKAKHAALDMALWGADRVKPINLKKRSSKRAKLALCISCVTRLCSSQCVPKGIATGISNG